MLKACKSLSLMAITFLRVLNPCLWRSCLMYCQHACATMSSPLGSSFGPLSISSTQWSKLLSARVPRLCHSLLSWTSSQELCNPGLLNQVRKSFWVITAFIRSHWVRGGVSETTECVVQFKHLTYKWPQMTDNLELDNLTMWLTLISWQMTMTDHWLTCDDDDNKLAVSEDNDSTCRIFLKLN